MHKGLITPLIVLSLLGLYSCSGDDESSKDEATPLSERTYVIFSPATSELPIPNDLLFADDVDGTMKAGVDPTNPVINGIDVLDGASVLGPIDISFTGSLDEQQMFDATNFITVNESVIPNPNQNVFLLPLAYPGGDPITQTTLTPGGDSVEAPTFYEAIEYQKAIATLDAAALGSLAQPNARASIISLDGGVNNTLRIQPLKPLLPNTRYLVALAGDVQDKNGDPVYPSTAYEYLRDPNAKLGVLSTSALARVQTFIINWEKLAVGYFGFMNSVFETVGLPASAPTQDNILFSLTFTTGGTDKILKSIAAPETFIEQSLRTKYKQDAIRKLVNGTYDLDLENGTLEANDRAINGLTRTLLTEPLVNELPNALYNMDISNAVKAGLDYATIAADPSAAFIMQTAAAEASIRINDSGSAEAGDQTDEGLAFNIATEALNKINDFVADSESLTDVAELFPIAEPRPTTFYRVDAASAINEALEAPALVYQGEITLPSYNQIPTDPTDGSAIKTNSWQTDNAMGALLDEIVGLPPGTLPLSTFTTHRYPFPNKVTDVTVPLVVTMPDPTTLGIFGITKPDDGWPVIIYVHGITADRSATLPLADALAFACLTPTDPPTPSDARCFATVAIDQPLHGVAPKESIVPGLLSVNDPDQAVEPNLPADTPNTPSATLTERHFNFTSDALSNPVPMDYTADVGASGSLFINLTNFAGSRDNLRQMVIDLLNLNASLDDMDVNADGISDDLDPNNVYFIGHSLGAVDGIPFVAVNNSAQTQASSLTALPKIKAAAFLTTGGGIPELLVNSPGLSSQILPGLAAASEELRQGKSGLESYLKVYQGVLDSVDPIHFAKSLSDMYSDTGVLLTEAIGDGTGNFIKDQVIPNAADEIWGETNGPLNTVLGNGFSINRFPAPFAGTEPLIAQFGAIKTADASSDGDPAVLVTRFVAGSHSTPVTAGNTDVDPFTSGPAFMEIFSEIATFFTLNGDVPGSIITNPEVVEN